MTNEYDDAIWELVDSAGRSPDAGLSALARDFSAAADAVLDLGCGDGLYLADLAANGVRVTGADRSAVALAREADRLPYGDVVVVSAAERLPLADNCVDHVWCCDTLEHVVDTQVVLSEIRRVLVPGGRVMVVTPDHPLRTRLRIALRGWEQHFDPFSPHLRFYTRRSLADALDDCGFSVESVIASRGNLVAEASRD